MVQRDAELLRRVATIQRFFGRDLELLTAPAFEPFPREVNGSSAYGTRFSRGDMSVYTLVNLAGGDDIATINISAGWAFRDCYHGGELIPVRGLITTTVEGRGIGCVFAQPVGAILPSGYTRFENVTSALAKVSLSSFSSTWSPLQVGAPSPLRLRLSHMHHAWNCSPPAALAIPLPTVSTPHPPSIPYAPPPAARARTNPSLTTLPSSSCSKR